MKAPTWLRLIAGLLLAPVLVAISLQLLPRMALGGELASFVAFAGAASVALAALALAVTAEVSLRVALSFAAAATTALVVIAYQRASSAASLVVVDAALLCVAWALGASLGRRVQHPAHLFPACVVAACADVVSLLSPEGPSHAVAKSERALSVLAIWFPVPGTREIAPALGVGDLLFVAFVLGVARAHRLGYGRAIVCCAVGIALAGGAAAGFGVAVPALVPIAATIIIGMPSIRRLRVADRRAAHLSMLIAASLALITLTRSAVGF
jgi:hypothetical protein